MFHGGPQLPARGRPANFPPEYHFVEIEYLGEGRNQGLIRKVLESKSRSLIELQARAAIAVIKHVAQQFPQAEYAIHGHSYGSAIATAVLSFLSDSKLAKPKGALLSGVLGRASTYEETVHAYNLITDVVAAQLTQVYPEIHHRTH